MSTNGSWAIALHGGAGAIPPETPDHMQQKYLNALSTALEHGVRRLVHGHSAVDVVESVVWLLEDEPLFNAGLGAVFTSAFDHELDAAVMDGSKRHFGAVAAVRTIRNPIRLARLVMDDTRHMFLVGAGAESFGRHRNLETVANNFFDTEHRREALLKAQNESEIRLDHDQGFGTVGAVACDSSGHLAAATSTGGMTNKLPGRVGDTPIIGAGTYASDETCAVSATGRGEAFMRGLSSYEVSVLMKYRGMSLADAANSVVFESLFSGDGGIIAVDSSGNIAMPFNSRGMYRASATATGHRKTAIF